MGIDDVRYANLLPVPLTTVRQPCLEIGEAALRAMLDRVAKRHEEHGSAISPNEQVAINEITEALGAQTA